MFVIVVVIINIPSLPNQRQMRFWHLAGLKSISHSQIILKLMPMGSRKPYLPTL